MSSLKKNTLMLYLLTASNYLFGLATIPYLTRVLGPEVYGQIGFATAFSIYIQLFLDFGFILSATAEIAEHRHDNNRVSIILSSVMAGKLVLIAASCIVVLILILFVPIFRADPALYVGYFAYIAVNSLIPDFLYRGLEQMSVITVRTVLVKAVFLAGILVFVKTPTDYILVPFFYLLGALAAVCLVYVHMKRVLDVRLCRVRFSDVVNSLKLSSSFFLSRIASTFYNSLNTLVMGFMAPASMMLGAYTACNNLIQAGRSLCSPVADSMYPYMVRNKNYALLFKVILCGEVVLLPLCVFAGFHSEAICILIFGSEYGFASSLLDIMLILVPISWASYLLGFPALSPIKCASIANASVVVGAVVQVMVMLVLLVFDLFCAESIAAATVLTEVVVLAIRVTTLLLKMKGFQR